MNIATVDWICSFRQTQMKMANRMKVIRIAANSCTLSQAILMKAHQIHTTILHIPEA